MKAKIRNAYNSLIKNPVQKKLPTTSDEESLIIAANFFVKSVMDETIPTVVKRRRLKLREDARLLVLLLLRDIVTYPILHAKALTMSQLVEAMQDDLSVIFEHVEGDSAGEISGHAILRSLEANWSTLKLNTSKIWSP